MTVLIADNSLTAAPEGRVEVRTADGRRLGYFTLAKAAPTGLPPGLTQEQFDREAADISGPGHTAAEVEALMKGWGCSR